jgi:hypothetical protein
MCERYVHLTKAKHIHKRQIHLLVRGSYVRTITARAQLKKISGLGLKGLDAKTN